MMLPVAQTLISQRYLLHVKVTLLLDKAHRGGLRRGASSEMRLLVTAEMELE